MSFSGSTPGANLYTQGFGSYPENVEIPVITNVDPSSTNNTYPIGKRWINSLTNSEFVLTSISTAGGVATANWQSLGGGSSQVSTLTGDTGTATPSGGNIKIAGTANQITTAAAGSTVTISLPSSITTPGSLTATTSLSAGTTVTGGTGVTATTGNVSATAGQVNAGTTMTAGTGITATTGNIVATAGQVNAGTTMTAGTGITATTGNIAASSGNVSASGTVTGGTGITATTGNVSATAGAVNAGTSMTASSGNITATSGNFVMTDNTKAIQFGAIISIVAGTGAPSASLPKGSLYLRTDGSGVNDRAYIATDSAGTWTPIVTVG